MQLSSMNFKSKHFGTNSILTQGMQGTRSRKNAVEAMSFRFESPAAQKAAGAWRMWAYVDDIFMRCPRSDKLSLVESLTACLRAVG